MSTTVGRHVDTRADGRSRHGAPTRHRKPTQSGDEDPTTVWWWIRTIASWMLLAVTVGVLAAMVLIPRLTGSTAYTILTGSMEPNMPPGTLIVVKPTPVDQLRVGQVITFQPRSGDPEVVTHRIIGVFYNSEGERRINTRGDANNVQDPWALEPGQVRGRVWYAVPYLGRVNLLLSGGDSRSKLITLAGGGLAVYAVWMVASGFRDRDRGPREADSAEDQTETSETK